MNCSCQEIFSWVRATQYLGTQVHAESLWPFPLPLVPQYPALALVQIVLLYELDNSTLTFRKDFRMDFSPDLPPQMCVEHLSCCWYSPGYQDAAANSPKPCPSCRNTGCLPSGMPPAVASSVKQKYIMRQSVYILTKVYWSLFIFYRVNCMWSIFLKR